MYDLLNRILKSLMSGSLSELNPQNIVAVSNEAVRIIEKTMPLNEYDVNNASMIISISQIVYNNTDRTVLFLDDGVYDILLEKYACPLRTARAKSRTLHYFSYFLRNHSCICFGFVK